MLDDFLTRAVLAGLGVVLAAAPLGCFVVWRRMAYFGDATAHAGILGIAGALALSLPATLGVLSAAVLMAGAVWVLTSRQLAGDTALGVLSHSALAFGLVAASMLEGVRLDLNAYLFGDILAVTRHDLAVIWLGAAGVAGLVWWRWNALLTATFSPELAYARGHNPEREALILTLALAVLVAVAIKVVGVLLVTAMLIIPAAAARGLASSPERMILWAGMLGAAAVLGGVGGSVRLDAPTGPMIVCAAALIFALSVLLGRLRR